MQTWMRARLVRRRLWFAVASVLAMLLLLVLVTWPDRATDLPPPPLSEEIEPAVESSPTQRAPSRVPEVEPGKIPDSAMREAAEAGDIEAMSQLGRAFAECREWTSLRSEEVDRFMVDLIEFVSQPGAQGPLVGIASSVDGSLEGLLHGMDALQARCSALDLPESPADRIAQALVWLEAAARAGDHSAMVAWSEHVFRRWPSRAELLDDIDAVRAAREQALAWLETARSAREPSALRRLALAHRDGDLAERDPLAAYAYLLAWQSGGFDADYPGQATLLRRELEQTLDAPSRAEAEARAEQLLREFGG